MRGKPNGQNGYLKTTNSFQYQRYCGYSLQDDGATGLTKEEVFMATSKDGKRCFAIILQRLHANLVEMAINLREADSLLSIAFTADPGFPVGDL